LSHLVLAEKCSNQRKYGKNKLKLNIWINNIKDAIKHNKIAHKEWKEAVNPKCPQNSLVLCKIETREIYLLKIRKEE
jgi:signal recognition particle subunit SEC65